MLISYINLKKWLNIKGLRNLSYISTLPKVSYTNDYKKLFLFKKFRFFDSYIRNFLFRVNLFILRLCLKSSLSTNRISSHPTLGNIFHYTLNQHTSLRFFYFTAWAAVIVRYKNEIRTSCLSDFSTSKVSFPGIKKNFFWENIRKFLIFRLESSISRNIRKTFFEKI